MPVYQGSCHCGAVQYEVEGTIENPVECNCSICRRRAHLLWFVPKANVKFISDEDALTSYQFGKKLITHRFCKICGTAMLSDGEEDGIIKAGLNLRAIDSVDLEGLELYKYDGASV